MSARERKGASVFLLGSVAATALCGLVLPLQALAQTASDQPAAAADPQATTDSQVEDIVVTAQRRSERLQNVPISVSSLTATSLESNGVNSTEDLISVAPGLVVTSQQRTVQIFLRGVGSQSTNAGDESNVSTYVDGVYMPSAFANIMSFNNIERVEVLRGPQGTLFGRNATGGLIQIITRDPTATPEVDASLNYGSYNTVSGAFYATGGTQQLAADIAIQGTHQEDGWGRSIVSGADVNRQRDIAARSKVLWTPTTDDRFTFIADWARSSTDIGIVRTGLPGSTMNGGYVAEGSIYDYTGNLQVTDIDNENWGVSAHYEHHFGFADLSYLVAYRDEEAVYPYDIDSGPFTFSHVIHQLIGTKSLQSELLLSGEAGRLTWATGLFAMHLDTDFVFNLRSIVPAANLDKDAEMVTESYAAFAQGTYALTDTLDLTLGARYTVDRRDLDGTSVTASGSAVPGTLMFDVSDSKTYEEPTWRVALSNQFTSEIMGYASVGRGFKSGVYNLSAANTPPVEPEILTSYEVGLKTEFFDRRLRFNTAIFHYDYDNIQLGAVTPTTTLLLNAGTARVNGAEFEFALVPPVPVGDLEINANLSLLDAEYTSFLGAPISTPNPAGGNFVVPGDASGNDMIRAPDSSFNVGFTYSLPVGGNDLSFTGNVYHSDGFFFEGDNRLRQSPYSVVNAEISYAMDGGRYRLRLFGRNLTDTEYLLSANASTNGDFVAPQAPMTIGVGLDVRWGG